MLKMNDLKKVYENTRNQDRQLFLRQVVHFRKIMCSTAFSLERKEREFENLAEAYFRCNLTEGDITLFKCTAEEFEIRNGYELFKSMRRN